MQCEQFILINKFVYKTQQQSDSNVSAPFLLSRGEITNKKWNYSLLLRNEKYYKSKLEMNNLTLHKDNSHSAQISMNDCK